MMKVAIDVPEGSIMAWLLKPRFQKPAPRVRTPRVRYTRVQKERGIT